jgi:tetratricopeptide (TPR) repeat protein
MRAIILLILTFSCESLFSQKMPEDYFEEGNRSFEQGNYERAIISFQYIVDHYPKNELYPKSYYNIGFIYYSQKNYNKSIDLFKRTLEINLAEEYDPGSNIIDSFYTDSKNRASRILSDIYYEKEMFDSALYYLSLSDTVYYYSYIDINCLAINEVDITLRYSDIYRKLNLPEKAISALLDVVFIRFADNTEVIEELKELLKDKKNLKDELDKSLETIIPVKEEKENDAYTWYYFKFLNNNIRIPYINDKNRKVFDKETVMKIIKDSDFYKMIETL